MRAEVIAVGAELLSGSIINSNAAAISQRLAAIGIETAWHTVVGDEAQQLRQAVDIARSRAEVILTTGGLGPTYDDLTKETICTFFGKKMEFHADIAEGIRAHYRTAFHMETMPENNLSMAWLPEGGTVLKNIAGTAPGCAFEAEGVHVILLPGPPYEMLPMLENEAIPYLRALSEEVTVSHDIMTFGVRESRVDELLRDYMEHLEGATLAPYAKPSEVRLRATAKGESAEAAQARLTPIIETVRKTLGNHVYGLDVAGVHEVCFRLLKEKGLTFATAESCTGGLAAAKITALSGASAVYRGGVVSYWSEVKRDALGVPWETIEEFGAVSEPCARAMAEGACRLTGAELAMSFTGVAGPEPDERGNPVGLVYVALATPEGTFCRKLENGKRRRGLIQEVSVNHGYDMLRRYLTGLPVETL